MRGKRNVQTMDIWLEVAAYLLLLDSFCEFRKNLMKFIAHP